MAEPAGRPWRRRSVEREAATGGQRREAGAAYWSPRESGDHGWRSRWLLRAEPVSVARWSRRWADSMMGRPRRRWSWSGVVIGRSRRRGARGTRRPLEEAGLLLEPAAGVRTERESAHAAGSNIEPTREE